MTTKEIELDINDKGVAVAKLSMDLLSMLQHHANGYRAWYINRELFWNNGVSPDDLATQVEERMAAYWEVKCQQLDGHLSWEKGLEFLGRRG